MQFNLLANPRYRPIQIDKDSIEEQAPAGAQTQFTAGLLAVLSGVGSGSLHACGTGDG